MFCYSFSTSILRMIESLQAIEPSNRWSLSNRRTMFRKVRCVVCRSVESVRYRHCNQSWVNITVANSIHRWRVVVGPKQRSQHWLREHWMRLIDRRFILRERVTKEVGGKHGVAQHGKHAVYLEMTVNSAVTWNSTAVRSIDSRKQNNKCGRAVDQCL